MFAIGTAEVKVSGTKLRVPKEYNLTKKDRKIKELFKTINQAEIFQIKYLKL